MKKTTRIEENIKYHNERIKSLPMIALSEVTGVKVDMEKAILHYYNTLSDKEKASFIATGKMKGLLTNEMVRNIIDEIIKYPDSIYELTEDVLDQDIVNRIVSYDKYIISTIPIKYQTIDLHKSLIDKNYKNVRLIPEEAQFDETIKYAISKSGDALNFISKNKITEEYCYMAFKKNKSSFKSFPDHLKTYDICIDALKDKGSRIKFVPSNMITEEFYNEIKRLRIYIPEKYEKYILENVTINNKKGYNIKLPIQHQTKSIENITIEEISDYFSNKAIDILNELEIKKLEELFELSKNNTNLMNIKNKNIKNEILGTINILKCEYLNEDPLINIYDTENNLYKINSRIGLSSRAINTLVRLGEFSSVKDFFESVSKTEFQKKIDFMKHSNNKSIKEIELKINVILNYYNRQKEEKENTDETLESLREELIRLKSENDIIIKKINEVLFKINEKNKANDTSEEIKCLKKN